MTYSNDQHLFVHEPALYTDPPIPGIERVDVLDGAISGTQLSSAAADFVDAGIEARMIAMVDQRVLEVAERIDAHTLSVSRLRTFEESMLLPPGDGMNLHLIVRSYHPFLGAAHEKLLHTLGVEHGSRIHTPYVARALEALIALADIFDAAITAEPESVRLWDKARMYRRRFRDMIRREPIKLDLDADGKAETTFRADLASLYRV